MGFDLSTAQPVAAPAFDLSTAKPVGAVPLGQEVPRPGAGYEQSAPHTTAPHLGMHNPVVAVGETAAHLGSAALSMPVSGIAGIVAQHLSNSGWNVDPEEVINWVQQHGTYQPSTEGGKAVTGAVNKVFGVVPKVANWAGEHVTDAAQAAGASPEVAAGAGATANTVIQALPMALGAKVAPAVDAVGRGVMKIPGAQTVADYVNPTGAANRLIKQYAGTPADQAEAAAAIDLHKAGQSGALAAKYGYQPTTAEVAQNTGLAQMERTLRNQTDTAPPLNTRTKENNAATGSNLQALTVDEKGRNAEALENLRDTASKAAYENALSNPVNAVPTTPAMSAATPSIDTAAAAAPPGAASAGLSPVGQRLQEVMQRPAMVDAIQAAKREAGNRGVKLDENNLIQNLHFAKMALDGQISTAVRSGNNVTAAGLMDTKTTLLGVINDLSPDYAAASVQHHALSAPLNRVQVGEALKNKYTSGMNDASGTGSTPSTFVNAVTRNGDQTARGATGFNGSTLENTLSAGDLESLRAVTEHLGRQNYAQNAGRGVGSNTAQNLANDQALEDVGSLRAGLGPVGNLVVGLHHPGVALADAFLGNRARAATRNRLTQMALNPQAAAAALRAARPSAVNALPPQVTAPAAIGAVAASQQQ
jgi:hypothetical protein